MVCSIRKYGRSLDLVRAKESLWCSRYGGGGEMLGELILNGLDRG